MKKGLDSLICLSLSSNRDCNAADREQASIPTDPSIRLSILRSWLNDFSTANPDELVGLVYLATCHRIEFYAYGVDPNELISRWTELCGQSVLKAELTEGLDTFEHLLKVTASLDSEVLGETQITGQVHKAYEEAREKRYLRGPLQRTFEEVFRVTKRIRSETKIGTGTHSVAHVAIDGLSEVFDDLENKSALVVGSGNMAEQSLQRLMRRGVGRIHWTNRTRSRLESKVLSSYCVIEDFEDLPKLAWEHPIVVLATAADSPILRLDSVKQYRSKVQNFWQGPRIVLDLGLPRNADERLHSFENFWIRNVDEFRDQANQTTVQRHKNLDQAQKIVSEASKSFTKLWNHWEQGALIAELFKSTEAILEKELSLINSQLSVEEKPEIEYLVRNVYAKMMHQLLGRLKSLEESQARLALETLNLAWRQSETSWQNKKEPNQHLNPQQRSQQILNQVLESLP